MAFRKTNNVLDKLAAYVKNFIKLISHHMEHSYLSLTNSEDA